MAMLDAQEMQLSLLLLAVEGVKSAGRAEELPCWGKEHLGGQALMLSFRREDPWERLEGPGSRSVAVGSQIEGSGHV